MRDRNPPAPPKEGTEMARKYFSAPPAGFSQSDLDQLDRGRDISVGEAWRQKDTGSTVTIKDVERIFGKKCVVVFDAGGASERLWVEDFRSRFSRVR